MNTKSPEYRAIMAAFYVKQGLKIKNNDDFVPMAGSVLAAKDRFERAENHMNAAIAANEVQS